MNIAIRVDASRVIGSGHVMRCLTLADALREKGAVVRFICRAHESNLIDFIRDKQYACIALDLVEGEAGSTMPDAELEKLPDHAPWLGVSYQRDAAETAAILKKKPCDWLIVDHYALDWRWESVMRPYAERIMVIDDLADRKHDCDVLLDSVCGRQPEHYRGLAPTACRLLLGSQFALLRPEFAEWRPAALQRREKTEAVRRFLVTLGGMDPDNLTGAVLGQMAAADLPADSEIEVVLGAGFSHTEEVKKQAAHISVKTDVCIAVNNMAERMANADFAITAGGVSALECCCLGLPAIVIVTAINQQPTARVLKKEGVGAIIPAESFASDFLPVFSRAIPDHKWYRQAVLRGSRLVDGQGSARAVGALLGRQ